MPRPKKCRRICALPPNRSFGPLESAPPLPALTMTLDEYECIRLIDLLDRTQEDCAMQMGVARTTVQAVYNAARRKLAQALVEGRRLRIQGGEYVLCARFGECGGAPAGKECPARRCGCPAKKEMEETE